MRWHNGVVECRHPQASLGLRADPRRRTLNTAYAECINARAKSVIPDHRRDVCLWHLTDKPPAPEFVRYWTNNGQRAVGGLIGSAANDPTATLAVHCGNGFDGGFKPLSKHSIEPIRCRLL